MGRSTNKVRRVYRPPSSSCVCINWIFYLEFASGARLENGVFSELGTQPHFLSCILQQSLLKHSFPCKERNGERGISQSFKAILIWINLHSGECPKSVKLLIIRLSVAESGCLMALKSPLLHHYVSVNSPSHPTEAPCWGISNATKKGTLALPHAQCELLKFICL